MMAVYEFYDWVCVTGSNSGHVSISTATPNRRAAHCGKRLPRQPHAGSDGSAAGDAGEEDGAERRVQRQLDGTFGPPVERGPPRRGGHPPVRTGGRGAGHRRVTTPQQIELYPRILNSCLSCPCSQATLPPEQVTAWRVEAARFDVANCKLKHQSLSCLCCTFPYV